MRIIVQKYGGSSLASPEHIKRIADRVIATKNEGYNVVVVVSALGDTTDHLLDLANQITRNPSPRELDMLLSVGERVSISLLAMAIQERNHSAISFTGSQVGIITSTDHTRARILEIKGDRIRKELQAGKIVVVAGYQGVSVEKEITTLGRGGSDTTAVALAAALHAEKCEIMSDVDGVYTANPRVVNEARLIPEISYDEMLDMADLGAQVLKASAIEFAKRHKIKIYAGSSFTGKIGTIITDGPLDRNRISAITFDDDVVLLRTQNQPNGYGPNIIKSLAAKGISVKTLTESDGQLSFLLKLENLITARHIIEEHQQTFPDLLIDECHDLGLLSVIGVGINFGTNVMAKILEAFEDIRVQPKLVNFSETRLTFGIEKARLQESTDHLHNQLLISKTHEKI